MVYFQLVVDLCWKYSSRE